MREALFRVQELDLKIDEIRRNIRDEKAAYASKEKRCLEAAARLDEMRAELKKVKTRVKGIESEVEAFQSKAGQIEKRRREITNVKQLEAMDSEAETLAAEIAAREDSQLAAYEELEKAEAAIAAQEARIEKLKADVVASRGTAKSAVAELKERGKAATVDRDAALGELEEALRRDYERLRESHGGRVAFLVEEARCPACSVEIPFCHYNKLSHNRERFFPCESCGRLLTYDGP